MFQIIYYIDIGYICFRCNTVSITVTHTIHIVCIQGYHSPMYDTNNKHEYMEYKWLTARPRGFTLSIKNSRQGNVAYSLCLHSANTPIMSCSQ